MLFNDPSCVPENTIVSQIQNKIPEFLGSDWFGIIILSQNFKYKIDAKFDINQIGDELVLNFLSNNKANLYKQDFKYKLYEYETNHFAIIPIRSTENYVVFFIHCRTQASGPFDIKDLEWNAAYANAAYKTLLINNELIQEQDYIENVLDSTESVIVVFDLNYKIVSSNKIAKKIFNIDKSGMTIVDINIEDVTKFIAAIERVTSKGKKEQLRNMIVIKNEKRSLLNVIISPLRNSKKIISGCVLVGNDITKTQILEYQFDQLRHYVVLGEIALGLSHDVKNPLTNIKGCAAVLKKSKLIKQNELNHLNLIIHEVDRIDEIINQMMSFGNVAKSNDYILLDINDVIYNCIQIINRQKVYRSIDVLYDLDRSAPLVKAKNRDIQQIFLNILINSLQAIENQGVIEIKSCYNKEEETLSVTISDNGIGIEPGIIDKLFEPYFTTKNDGTGLGLFIAKQVLNKYGGIIKISSTKNTGTLCEIRLPMTASIIDNNIVSEY